MSSRWLINLRGYPAFLGYHVSRLATRPAEVLRKLHGYWKRRGTRATLLRIYELFNTFAIYDRWCRLHDTLTDADKARLATAVDQLAHRPLISVLMPVWNTPERFLRRAIESVQEQVYPDWELCIADDASSAPHVRTVLEELSRRDSRIKVRFRTDNGHISEASNSALELCSGEFVALLDHDDELPPHALYWVARALADDPALEVIYTDEDKVDAGGRRFGHYFKPDWNPELLLGQNLVSHLGVYRTETVRRIGGFRKGYEGCQDWDLALRITETVDPERIHHIPKVLYHWRTLEGSTAIEPEQKSYVVEAARHTVQECLARRGVAAKVELAFGSFLRVRYALPDPPPRVSVITVAGDAAQLEAMRRQTVCPAVEWIAVDAGASNRPVPEEPGRDGVRVIHVDGVSSRAALMNAAAGQATGAVLCFVDAGLTPLDPGWLEELCTRALQPGTGAVGALVFASASTIRHAGIVLGLGPRRVAGYAYAGGWRRTPGYAGRAALAQNLSAVSSACMAVRADAFAAAGGFDATAFPDALADVDFCLRLAESGLRNVWTPFAEVMLPAGPYSIEVTADSADDSAAAELRARWGALIENDPYFNPNLSLDEPWPTPAFPPRLPEAMRCRAGAKSP